MDLLHRMGNRARGHRAGAPEIVEKHWSYGTFALIAAGPMHLLRSPCVFGKQSRKRLSAYRGSTEITAPPAEKSWRARTRSSGRAIHPAVPCLADRQMWTNIHEPARV